MEIHLPEQIQFHDRRANVAVLHSCQDMRVLLINLLPGQSLEPHTSSSSVSLHVIAGTGDLYAGGDWVRATTGSIRFYEPNQPHGVRANTEPLTVLATIAPLP